MKKEEEEELLPEMYPQKSKMLFIKICMGAYVTFSTAYDSLTSLNLLFDFFVD